jgi:hypothetical protein
MRSASARVLGARPAVPPAAGSGWTKLDKFPRAAFGAEHAFRYEIADSSEVTRPTNQEEGRVALPHLRITSSIHLGTGRI